MSTHIRRLHRINGAPPVFPNGFAELADAECGRAGAGQRLLDICQRPSGDVVNTAVALIPAARGQHGECWAERRVAVLLLEHQLLRLPPDDLAAFDLVLTAFGLKPRQGDEVPLHDEVLDQGFSTTVLPGFVRELVRRLARLHRVHLPLRRADCGRSDWRVLFLRAARDVSKLTLARYVFSPDEVVREIARTLEVTTGAEHALSRIGHDAAPAAVQEPLDARRYEADILRGLCAGHRIYWVSPRCGSELHAMVEYPLGSAVVVIKPPGSDLEIEIKRAGTRGPRLLQVITERHGRAAPLSHRLFGGSLGWLARREAAAASVFSTIFALVHGRDDPCSHTVSRSSIVEVPGADGPVHLLDYLTDHGAYGEGFDDMRGALGAVADSFPASSGVARASYHGERGRTLQFIGQATPEQAVIRGSSSFRFDRLALYLSDEGPEEYFVDGLGRQPEAFELRWFADVLLEEVLGELVVPPNGFREYSQYVRDAFSVPENRARADRHYLSAMRQLGDCWGTLLAMRGFSDGESFVQRNVGLRSIWRDGEWFVRVIIMDHDDLTVAGVGPHYISPWREVSGMQRDEVHIMGGASGPGTIPGDAGALQDIYRVDEDTANAGRVALKEAALAAYARGQAALAVNGELRELFPAGFLDLRADYYELVARFLRADQADLEPWTQDAKAFLAAKGYGEEQMATYTKSIYHFRMFFDRMRFLYSR